MGAQEGSTKRSRWGRTRVGGTWIPALAVAVPIGVALALGTALGVYYGGGLDSDPLLTVGILGVAIMFPAIALVYAIVVDRTTIKGAVARPEESIESRWYEKAAAGTFTDLLLVAGILAVVASFMTWTAELNLVFSGLILLAMVDFAIRYLLIRKRS